MRTIAVDLTPVLPGGENGGAKIFALELVRRMSADMPHARFVLLTQAESHDELSSMDRDNVTRAQVVGGATSRMRSRVFRFASALLSSFPPALRRAAARWGFRLHTMMKRGGSRSLLRDMDVDLLFCPFTAPTFHEEGIPTVCTVYDLQYRTHPQFFSPEDAVLRERAFEEAARLATALVAISDYSRDSAISHGKLDPRRITTIPIRLAQWPPPADGDAARVMHRLGLLPRRFFIYPANFWQHKNHEALLAAFGIAGSLGLDADFKLVCTGASGAREGSVKETARRMGLGRHVVFPGYVSRDELSALIAVCRALVFPSLYEGFGLPVIEAMAAGVPVACSNTAALPEVSGGAAMLFDPRDPEQIARAMVSLANDEALRSGLVAAGKIRAAEFADPERMAAEYRALFESVVGKNR